MNDNTKTNDVTEEESFMSKFIPFLNYTLNRYMPFLLVSFICFYSFGYLTWEPYFVLALMIFSNNYYSQCGYAQCCLDAGIVKDDSND
tara:strand:+ start:3228 stop:3491 length:264 start_codon:yes stop_codon:yes gene_type:complete